MTDPRYLLGGLTYTILMDTDHPDKEHFILSFSADEVWALISLVQERAADRVRMARGPSHV